MLIFRLCSILEYILTSTLLPILAIIRGLGLLILPPVNAGPRTTMSFPLLSACPFLLVAVHVYVPESMKNIYSFIIRSMLSVVNYSFILNIHDHQIYTYQLPAVLTEVINNRVPFLSMRYFPPELIRFPFFLQINFGCGAPSGSHLVK